MTTASEANPFEMANEDAEQEELQGKITDYLAKLNEILGEYERQRVIESAILNLERFNGLL